MRLFYFLIVVLALWVSPLAQGGDQAPHWEYKIVPYTAMMLDIIKDSKGLDQAQLEEASISKLEPVLNKLGAEGWELCADTKGAFVFKRPKSK